MTEKKNSDARIKANNKYNKANIRQYVLKLNIKTDADVIELLDSIEGSKQGYIKQLIRDDISKKQNNNG